MAAAPATGWGPKKSRNVEGDRRAPPGIRVALQLGAASSETCGGGTGKRGKGRKKDGDRRGQGSGVRGKGDGGPRVGPDRVPGRDRRSARPLPGDGGRRSAHAR